MNRTRLIIWLSCLLIFVGSVAWLRSQGHRQADLPTIDLSALPLELAGYQGEDVDVDDETVRVADAYSYINRTYNDSLGRAITMHAANFLNSDWVAPTPHHPQYCYTGAGWEIVARRTVVLPRPQPGGESGWPIELIHFRQSGQDVVTAHWFQVGGVVIIDNGGFYARRFQFLGNRSPSTLKVLLQVAAPSIDAAESPLREFSEGIIDAFQSQGHSAGIP